MNEALAGVNTHTFVYVFMQGATRLKALMSLIEQIGPFLSAWFFQSFIAR
jgi:hypothetical protein